MSDTNKHGYKGKWVYIDLTKRSVEVRASDAAAERELIGGRGLQAHLLAQRVQEQGWTADGKVEPGLVLNARRPAILTLTAVGATTPIAGPLWFPAIGSSFSSDRQKG